MIRPPDPEAERFPLHAVHAPCCRVDATSVIRWTNAAFRAVFGQQCGVSVPHSGLRPVSGTVAAMIGDDAAGAWPSAETVLVSGECAFAASLTRLEDGGCLVVLTRLGDDVPGLGVDLLPPAGGAVHAVRPDRGERPDHVNVDADADKFRALCDNAPVGILCSDVGIRVSFVNERCAEVFGTEPGDLLGFGWLDQMADDRSAAVAMEAVTATVETGEVAVERLVIRRPDGTDRLVDTRFGPIFTGTDVGFVATVEDVTDAVRAAGELERHSTTDTLTGLANRRTLEEALVAELDDGGTPALLFLDLDNFKMVNDTLGHQAGDELLCAVAERLGCCVRHDDLVARLGGDEFVVLLRGEESVAAAEAIAERIVADVNRPLLIAGREIRYVSASVGVVRAAPGRDAGGVLKDADLAMYQAKKAGRNRSVVFDRSAREAAERRQAVVDLVAQVVRADHDRVMVRYQPICSPQGEVTSFEALCRLRGDDEELSPDLFIPPAEEFGMISGLGRIVRGAVLDQLAEWWAAGREVPVAVNLSAAEICRSLVEEVATELATRSLPTRAFRLEVTESGVMADVEVSRQVLSDLSEMGVSVSIDDFGIGHSSLAYLKWLPARQLKVDRSFVAEIDHSPQDRAILAAVLALAESLDLEVVAEGVETEAQRDVLASAGVGLLQGWLFNRPLDAAAATALLRAEPVPA